MLFINRAESVERRLAENTRVIEPPGLVKRRNHFHILSRQLKIKDVQIFCHTFRVGSLGNYRSAPLNTPAQQDLCGRFSVLQGDALNDAIVQK